MQIYRPLLFTENLLYPLYIMKILIIGSGGREHTFAWKITQSPACTGLFVAPGNAGTATIATNLAISVTDFPTIAEAVLQHQIELVIVGPEAPLVAGIVDFFRENEALNHVAIIGPDASGATLEGSKDFSKAFMQKYGIPAAASVTFTKETLSEGFEYLENKATAPYVLKADGLAAGKGVIITEDLIEAKQELKEMLSNAKFGEASSKVLIEEHLKGIELSVFVLTDGKNYKILPEAKDYKRIGEEDTGLNTGGMGAVSPVPFANAEFLKKVEEQVVKPTLKGLQEEGIHYVGFIFIGLMNTEGEPNVIEYNVRMGDPETEVVFPRISNDFVELFKATAAGELDKVELKVISEIAVTSVVVAEGYPEAYKKGIEITIPKLEEDTLLFHGGTRLQGDMTVTDGGRVMACTGIASTLTEAVRKSQGLAENVSYNGKYYRKDIGKDLIPYL